MSNSKMYVKNVTLQLTGIRRIDGELLCVRDAGADGSGRWKFVAVDVDIVDDFSLNTLILVLQLQFRNCHA